MSSLNFTSSEMRIATGALATVAALLPTLYFLWPARKEVPNQHLKTFDNFIKAYPSLDPQALTIHMVPGFKHQILPSNLNLPSRSLQPFRQHATQIFSLFSHFSMNPQSNGTGQAVHFSKETNTVIAHCKMGGHVNGESDVGKSLIDVGITEWWTECVLFVSLTYDGLEVLEVREFVDSAKAKELESLLSGLLR